MILYKNVDVVDLESILTRGILSMDASGGDIWEFAKCEERYKQLIERQK